MRNGALHVASGEGFAVPAGKKSVADPDDVSQMGGRFEEDAFVPPMPGPD